MIETFKHSEVHILARSFHCGIAFFSPEKVANKRELSPDTHRIGYKIEIS